MNGSVPEADEEWTLYRYAESKDLITKERILHVLSEQENGLDEDGFQTVVSDVTSFEQKIVEHVP
ncbi:hypothetical protein N0O92_07965 [Alkalihalobacillus sp. MEB130]|uniref:hypothetical protein n=1 Tax=Alkalihalobacillus sp. MEB130 TaxID=2976704 RepID=UPI0028DE97C8|nr:hypothetical protein [Alkalihalobacillus sp. MEB130]MDT8860166.1 hypothetical protein [Alkalihalobacillus sp. MEB130]